ncbi:hypothetical protein H9L39_20214 [Fusarium oxysporum f. sp. albedinis]|nr:hypothetical protein H9L39_20214 [Fusarium oxysporum f. sp. albedinis]
MLFTTVWNWLLEQMGLAYTAKTTNAATYKTSSVAYCCCSVSQYSSAITTAIETHIFRRSWDTNGKPSYQLNSQRTLSNTRLHYGYKVHLSVISS